MSPPKPKHSLPPKPEMIRSERFGPFSLIAKIGQGGMGSVYLGAKRGLHDFTKLVVVKRLHDRFAHDAVTVEMFLDEARLAARLSNPHVVQTYEVGEVDGVPFLSMEYLEGQPLSRLVRTLVRSGQQMPLSIAVQLFVDVLEGLHHAHTLRDFDGTPLHVIHRDISPGNIFITYDGHAKLLDFGVARARTHVHQTMVGVVKGKLAYLAPEVARAHDYDHRADLWSLGIVMWESLAGERLFKGESDAATLGNVLHSDVQSLDTLGPVPDRLAAFVDRALERDPANRYASAAEMREELEAFRHDEGLRTSRSEVGRFVSEFFARERDELRRVLKAHMALELSQPSSADGQVSARTASGSSGPRATGSFASLLRTPKRPPNVDSQDRLPVEPVSAATPTPASAPSRWMLGGVFLVAISFGIGVALMSPPEAEPVRSDPPPPEQGTSVSTERSDEADTATQQPSPGTHSPGIHSPGTHDPVTLDPPATLADPDPPEAETTMHYRERPHRIVMVEDTQEAEPEAALALPTHEPEALPPEEVASETMRPVDVQPTAMQLLVMQPTAMRPTAMRPTAMRPTAMRPTAMRPTAMRPTAMRPAQMREEPEAEDFLTF